MRRKPEKKDVERSNMSSGITPIGQGWTNARGLRGLGGPKPDPNNKFFRKFGTRRRILQRSLRPVSWIRGQKSRKRRGGDRERGECKRKKKRREGRVCSISFSYKIRLRICHALSLATAEMKDFLMKL